MSSDHPHVVLIMADHLRRDCLSCYGDIQVNTPHLDSLAEESVVFDGAYCATPLCVPTRVSMYTGKWPHTHGAIVNGEKPYDGAGPDHRTLFEALNTAGYGITHVGVQHCSTRPRLENRLPAARFIGETEWHEYATSREIVIPLPETHRTGMPNVEWTDGRPVVVRRNQARRFLYPHAAEDHRDVFWSRLAENAIRELDTNTPQYIETLFWAPHPPLFLPEPYYSMYPPDTIELPETVGRWYDGQPASLLMQSCGQMAMGRIREEYRDGWSAYMGLVTMVDECIGRVVQALKDKGIWDNALIIFTQDHGDLMGCHCLTQKHCFYEEAAHIPLLIKPPGGAAGTRDSLASAIDFCPTVCDYAGVDSPHGVQGQSLRPVTEDTTCTPHDAVFMEYNGDQGRNPWPMRAVVTNVNGHRWKYIRTMNDVDELYNLSVDPMEKESLASSPAHQRLRQQLHTQLTHWMTETGDTLEMPNEDFITEQAGSMGARSG